MATPETEKPTPIRTLIAAQETHDSAVLTLAMRRRSFESAGKNLLDAEAFEKEAATALVVAIAAFKAAP